jgi:hypothetical protein
VAVPVDAPYNTPDPEKEATDVLLLAHVPPPASVRVTALPEQITSGPEMAAGNGLTVKTIEVLQPVGSA